MFDSIQRVRLEPEACAALASAFSLSSGCPRGALAEVDGR